MVEVTQEDREAAADILDEISSLTGDDGIGQVADLSRDGEYDEHHAVQRCAAHRQAAFNAGRASVLAELERPSEAMVEAGADAFADNAGSPAIIRSDDENAASDIFTAIIGAYKEAL